MDTPSNLKGDLGTTNNTGNDTFNATQLTLNVFDSIDGGANTDTLNIAFTGLAVAFALPASTTFAGFENVNVSHAGTNADTNAIAITNTTFGTGVKSLKYVEAGAGTTSTASVTLASATDVSLISTGVAFTTVAVTDTSTTAASTGSTLKTITINKATGAGTLTGNGITTLNVATRGGVDTITAAAGTRELTVNTSGTGNITGVTDANATTLTLNNSGIQTLGTYTAAKATTVNVNSTAAATGLVVTAATATTLNIGGTATVAAVITGSTALKAINVSGANSGFTSVVDLSGIATGLETITTTHTSTTATSGVATFGATTATAGFGIGVLFTGGAGNDTITVGGTTKAITVGGGTNIVNMLAGATVIGVGGSINATAGTTDTLVLANADAVTLTTTGSAAFKAAVTGFEKLNISTATGTTISMTAFGSFDTLAFTTAAVTQVISGFSTGKTLEATFGATQTSLTTNNLSGATDTTTIRLLGDLSTARAFGTFTTPGVETVTITTVDSNAAFTSTLSTVTLVDTTATTINVTGNNGLALTFAGTALVNFNAGGLTKGAVTYTAGALNTDAVVTGSVSGGDTLNFGSAVAKVTITATAGTNALTGSSTIASTITGGSGADTIVGGSGIDTIVVGAGGTTNTVTGAAARDTINLTGSTGADTIIFGIASTAVTSANVDIITGFTSGTDKIQLTAGDNSAAAGTITAGGLAGINLAAGSTLATMLAPITSAVSVADIAAVYTQLAIDLLTTTNAFAASATGAGNIVGRVVTYTNGAAAGTYLVLNDVTASFQAATDQVIQLVGNTTFAATDLTVV